MRAAPARTGRAGPEDHHLLRAGAAAAGRRGDRGTGDRRSGWAARLPTTPAPGCSPRWTPPRSTRPGTPLPYGGAALAGCAGLGGVPRLRDVAAGRRHRRGQPADRPVRRLRRCTGRRRAPAARTSCCWTPRWSASPAVLEKELPGCPPGLAALPGAGAAGGLGAALLALGGRVTSGIGAGPRADRAGRRRWTTADLVITGEGSFDDQSLRGKLVSGVAAAAPGTAGCPAWYWPGGSTAGRREAARGRGDRGAQPGRAPGQRRAGDGGAGGRPVGAGHPAGPAVAGCRVELRLERANRPERGDARTGRAVDLVVTLSVVRQLHYV